MPIFSPTTTSAVRETSWEVNANITLENTTSMADLKVRREAMPGDGNMKIDGGEVATEQRLRFKGMDGRLKGVTGVYFYREAQEDQIDIGDARFDDRTTTAAGFGEATLSAFD